MLEVKYRGIPLKMIEILERKKSRDEPRKRTSSSMQKDVSLNLLTLTGLGMQKSSQFKPQTAEDSFKLRESEGDSTNLKDFKYFLSLKR